MALILNIESATSVCSVAIAKDGKLLAYQEEQESYQHASKMTLLVEACMEAANISFADLDAVAVSQGPGSYTALRVGMSTAKGLCFGLDLPLIGIPTLKILAQGIRRQMDLSPFQANTLIVPMIDARRMEVYTNLYTLDLEAQGEDEAKIIDENSYKPFFISEQNLIFTGDGSKKCESVISNPGAIFHPSDASAQDMVPLTKQAFLEKVFLNIAYAEPFYLKPPNITTPKKLL